MPCIRKPIEIQDKVKEGKVMIIKLDGKYQKWVYRNGKWIRYEA